MNKLEIKMLQLVATNSSDLPKNMPKMAFVKTADVLYSLLHCAELTADLRHKLRLLNDYIISKLGNNAHWCQS